MATCSLRVEAQPIFELNTAAWSCKGHRNMESGLAAMQCACLAEISILLAVTLTLRIEVDGILLLVSEIISSEEVWIGIGYVPSSSPVPPQ